MRGTGISQLGHDSAHAKAHDCGRKHPSGATARGGMVNSIEGSYGERRGGMRHGLRASTAALSNADGTNA